MQQEQNLKENVKKYLDRKSTNSNSPLDSIFKSFVKGDIQVVCEKYPFIKAVSANLKSVFEFSGYKGFEQYKHGEISKSKEVNFLSFFFEQNGFFGEIVFFNDHAEYLVTNDNDSDSERIVLSENYPQSNVFKTLIDRIWNEVNNKVQTVEEAKKEQIKKEKSKYKKLYWLFYGIACAIAIGVILYNRTTNDSKALWFLIIALIPAIIGSFFKYKTLDR